MRPMLRHYEKRRFPLDEARCFGRESDRQIQTSPGSGRTCDPPLRRVVAFLGSEPSSSDSQITLRASGHAAPGDGNPSTSGPLVQQI